MTLNDFTYPQLRVAIMLAVFTSMRSFARALGTTPQSVTRVLKGTNNSIPHTAYRQSLSKAFTTASKIVIYRVY